MKGRGIVLLLAALALASAGALAEGPPPPPPPESGREGEDAVRASVAGDTTSISGRVLSPTGSPLPVDLHLMVQGPTTPEGRLDRRTVPVEESGRFTVEGLERGRFYRVEAQGGSGAGRVAADRVPCGTRDLELVLRAAGTIAGRVLDEEGRPAGAGITVTARRTQRGVCGTIVGGEQSTTRTREDGTFLVEFLDAADFTVTAATGPEGAGRVAAAWKIPLGSTGVVLRLPAGDGAAAAPPDDSRMSPHEPAPTAITGRLLLREGAELPGDFLLEVLSGEGVPRRSFHPDADGAFDTGTLPAGSWTLVARSADGLVAGERERVREGSRDVAIPLDPHGWIEGRVLAADGTPVGAGFVVTASVPRGSDARGPGRSGSARTRGDGTFLVEYLGEFRFTLSVAPPQTPSGRSHPEVPASVARDVPPGSRGTTLRFVAPARVRGVLLSSDGKPILGQGLAARQEDRDGGEYTTTGGDGNFEFHRLAPGKFRVSVTRGKETLDLGEFEAPAEGLVLRLPEGAEGKGPGTGGR